MLSAAVVTQQVLPLEPDGAMPIGPVAALLEAADGGVVYVNGMATFPLPAGDEVARRLAAVLLVEQGFAKAGVVAAAFHVTTSTLWNWRRAFAVKNMAGLIPEKKGPRGPSKLTTDVVERIRALRAHGLTLATIADQVGRRVNGRSS